MLETMKELTKLGWRVTLGFVDRLDEPKYYITMEYYDCDIGMFEIKIEPAFDSRIDIIAEKITERYMEIFNNISKYLVKLCNELNELNMKELMGS